MGGDERSAGPKAPADLAQGAEPLPGIEEGDHRRCGPIALGVRDDLRFVPLPSPQ